MSAYKKLMAARIKLQSSKLTKSGNNKFAGYQYFELGDFLPTVQNIFNELGLCGVVSFTQTLATLRVVDVDNPESFIEFTSPMGSAALKGCHEVQNIGAVETYQRRYLWVTAMEIVEHDALDSVTGSKQGQPLTADEAYKAACESLKGSIDVIKAALAEGNLSTAAEAWFELSDEEKMSLWKAPKNGGIFTTRERDIMKSKEFRQAHYGEEAA